MQKLMTPIELLQGRKDILKLTQVLTRLFNIFRECEIKDNYGYSYNYDPYRACFKFMEDFKSGLFDRILLMGKEDLMLEVGKERPPESLTIRNYEYDRDQAILCWRLQEGY